MRRDTGGTRAEPASTGGVSPGVGPAPDPRWQALALLFGGPPTAGDHRPDTPGGRAPRTRHPSGADGVVPVLPPTLPPALADRLARTPADRLRAEHVRLFVNAMPELPCPPYASVHLEGVLYGTATARVRDLYRKWGVEADEVPDHFAVEAAFVAGLVGAAATDDEAARDLAWLGDHLRAWAPRFLARVEAEDRTGVYAEAARWARTLLDELEVPERA